MTEPHAGTVVIKSPKGQVVPQLVFMCGMWVISVILVGLVPPVGAAVLAVFSASAVFVGVRNFSTRWEALPSEFRHHGLVWSHSLAAAHIVSVEHMTEANAIRVYAAGDAARYIPLGTAFATQKSRRKGARLGRALSDLWGVEFLTSERGAGPGTYSLWRVPKDGTRRFRWGLAWLVAALAWAVPVLVSVAYSTRR